MTKDKNTNCLEGMKCPKCGSLEPFEISCSVMAEVFDSGTVDYYDVEWTPQSTCICTACRHVGTVREFAIQEQENA